MPDQSQLMSPQDFAASIRAKYPGAYDSIPDADLTNKILAKYPVYRERVTMIPKATSPVANQAFIRARNSMPAPPNAILADQPKTSGGQLGQEIGDTATAVNTKLANIPSGIGSMIGSVASAKSPEDFMKNQMVNMAQSYVQDSAKAQKQGGPQTPLPLFGAAQTLGIDPSAVRESALNNDTSSLTAETAGPIAQIMAAKGIAKGGAELAGKRLLPSRAIAGAALEDVKGAIGTSPVDVSQPGNIALRIKDIAGAGASAPKVVTDFIRRVTDPAKGPLTFAEARDFYSNASERLSMEEQAKLTPKMKFQLSQFTRSLGKSIQDAAEAEGQGGKFKQAMTEYRKASKIHALRQDSGEFLLDQAKAKLPWLALGYGVKKLYDVTK